MTTRPEHDASGSAEGSLEAEAITRAALEAGLVPPARLREILCRGGEAACALARLLGEVERDDHAELLSTLEREAHGLLRREVRRALYRLRQRGIAAPTLPEDAPAPQQPAAPVEPEGWISHIDGRGDVLVWITKPLTGGGLLFIAAQVNDREGLGDLSVGEISRRGLRTTRDELRDRHGLRMVAIDWRQADALLLAAHGRTATPPKTSYPAVRARLTADSPATAEPPIYRHLDRRAIDPELVAVSAELLAEPEMRSWLPEPAAVEPFARELLGLQESPLVLSRHQQEDRVAAVVQRAARELFPAAVVAPRLEQIAYYFWGTRRERQARIALAAAHALATGGAALDVPLLAQLVRASVAAAYGSEQAHAEEADRASVLVKPRPSRPVPEGTPRRPDAFAPPPAKLR